jgi:hypothetical protein
MKPINVKNTVGSGIVIGKGNGNGANNTNKILFGK